MASADFVHLHGHSEYSLLDGACRVGEMAELAAEQGMPALAITDHGNLFGVIEHYKACQDAGIKPIIGCEVYVAIDSRHARQAARGLTHASNHLVLLAKDATGYRNLTKLVSKGYLEGYYYNPRIDKELLREHAEGLICTSACIGGEIPHLIQREGLAAAEKVVREFMDIFGDDYYLEIQRHDIDPEAKVNDGLLKLHRKLGVPLVATNDFHFLRATDHDAHDALICIQTNKTVDEKSRMCYPDGLYMKSPEEMRTLFADLPDALERTLEIADKCNVELEFGKTYMPDFPIPAGYASSDDYLTQLAQEGLERRYRTVDPAVRERLDYELSVITSQDFSGYFLIVWDLVNYARNQGISVGPGRGSAAGCLASYCLGITNVDPIKYDLIFERFLNPERIEPPDIDVDFDDTRRDEVLRYVVDKYGKDNVSQVITFGTMGAKAVVRDVGRVLGMSFGEVDRIAKQVPTELKITLDKAIERVPELRQVAQAPGNEGKLIEHARKLEGMARHASVHACAVIIAPGELTNYVPLYRSPKNGTITTQFVGETCMDIGLLKMDILGLKELSLVEEAVRLIRLKEPDFDLEAIPWDDRATFDLFGRGETIGVFQFESAGMREYLIKLEPDTIEDIIAMNALYRPGPMDNIPTFIARKRGEEAVAYDHPKLESILEPTYGIMVYQEQVMRIASDLAGFTMGEADVLRKAMGKKIASVMEAQREKFLTGAVERGLAAEVARKIWDLMEYFAGYGFNKSHSAAYALLAYQTAFLKANYPACFMAALLTIERQDTGKLGKYLGECRDLGVTVLPPDINESEWAFTVTPAGIRFGLGAVKNVGDKAIESILAVRRESGRLTSLNRLCEDADLQAVNKRVLESLVKAGAFDSVYGDAGAADNGAGRRLRSAQLLAMVDGAIEHGTRRQRSRSSGQHELFGESEAVDSGGPAPRMPDVPAWTEVEQLKFEKEALGLYLSGHPMDRFRKELDGLGVRSIDTLTESATSVTVGGIISDRRNLKTRKGDPMAVVTLEDRGGRLEAVVFPEAFRKYGRVLDTDADTSVVVVSGKLEVDDETARLVVSEARLVDSVLSAAGRPLVIRLASPPADRATLEALKEVVGRHPGDGRVALEVDLRNQIPPLRVRLRLNRVRVRPSDRLIEDVEEVCGRGAVSWG
jgi:DNA polymerase-3 subunit alpha